MVPGPTRGDAAYWGLFRAVSVTPGFCQVLSRPGSGSRVRGAQANGSKAGVFLKTGFAAPTGQQCDESRQQEQESDYNDSGDRHPGICQPSVAAACSKCTVAGA